MCRSRSMSGSRTTGPVLTSAAVTGLLACVLVGCSGDGKRRVAPVDDAGVPRRSETFCPPCADRGMAEPAGAECPQTGDDIDAYLDSATKLYDQGKFAAAYGCSQIAVDLGPTAVEAHHLHAASLAALGHYRRAQWAFAAALALDPDDAETLAAAADFYINILPAKRRETTSLGLRYATRGAGRATTRRRTDNRLRARLSLLQGEALTDLGRAAEALERVDEALALAPDLHEASFERAVALYHLVRFDEAEMALSSLLAANSNDAFLHYQLGLVLEAKGESKAARERLARAAALAPNEFPHPVPITAEAFDELLAAAVAELPADEQALLKGVELVVVERPSRDDLLLADPPFSPAIVGLFRRGDAASAVGGVTMAGRSARAPAQAGKTLVKLYRRNLRRLARDLEDLRAQVRRTLRHELGHVRGWDEAEVRRRGRD
mgnify:CR=1 FL=1